MSKYTESGCLFLNQIQKKGSLLLAKENMFLQKKSLKKTEKYSCLANMTIHIQRVSRIFCYFYAGEVH